VRGLALIVLASACGSDDVDLTGTYVVDADVGSMPCGNDQPVVMPSAALVFTKEELFGTPYFSMDMCTDAAATNCSGGGLFGYSFAEPIDDGWSGVIYSASGTSSCAYVFAQHTATLEELKLVVDIEVHSEDVTDGSPCTAEEAERRGASMPCTKHERIDATRL
jgi:hypothetical protein